MHIIFKKIILGKILLAWLKRRKTVENEEKDSGIAIFCGQEETWETLSSVNMGHFLIEKEEYFRWRRQIQKAEQRVTTVREKNRAPMKYCFLLPDNICLAWIQNWHRPVIAICLLIFLFFSGSVHCGYPVFLSPMHVHWWEADNFPF